MSQRHLTREQRKARESGKHFLGEMREWRMRKEFMPDVVVMINRNQWQRMVLYIDHEFRYSDIARNDPSFHMCDTSKYKEYIFLQSSDPHQLALALWNDKVINKYMHQTYLMQKVSADLKWVANHESLKGEGKIIKLFGDKGVISMLGPMIPSDIELSPSEKKATRSRIYI